MGYVCKYSTNYMRLYSTIAMPLQLQQLNLLIHQAQPTPSRNYNTLTTLFRSYNKYVFKHIQCATIAKVYIYFAHILCCCEAECVFCKTHRHTTKACTESVLPLPPLHNTRPLQNNQICKSTRQNTAHKHPPIPHDSLCHIS